MSTPPTPFAFTQGVTMLSRSAILRRSSSTARSPVSLRFMTDLIASSGFFAVSMKPLMVARTKPATTFGFALAKSGFTMMALPYMTMPWSLISITEMSAGGILFCTRLKNEENEKPVIASTLPCASIGSRTGKPTFSIFTFEPSKPLTLVKARHWAKAPSGAGAPSVLPSRSLGELMPDFFRLTMAKGGRS